MCWTINEVMIEADQIERENDGNITTQTHLTRLNYDQRIGRLADLDKVAELRKTLSVRPTKQAGRVILSEPFGVYYTRLTVPYESYHEVLTRDTWDSNPIETAEVWMIPPGVTASLLQTDMLKRAKTVKLHLTRGIVTNIHKLLDGLQLRCTTLMLNNVKLYLLNKFDLMKRVQSGMPGVSNILFNQ